MISMLAQHKMSLEIAAYCSAIFAFYTPFMILVQSQDMEHFLLVSFLALVQAILCAYVSAEVARVQFL